MKQILSMIAILLFTLPAFAGVVYDVENKDMRTSPETVTSTDISIDGKLLKIDLTNGNGSFDGQMIFRGDSREMILVNHKEKSYFVLDEEQLKVLSAQVNRAMASMQQAMAAFPESQRAQMEKMMKSKMPAMVAQREPAEVVKTRKSDTINGYPCVKYLVKRGGTTTRELWVTDWKNVEGGSQVSAVFEEMAGFMKDMLDNLPQMAKQQSFGDPTFEFMKQIKGFPVLTREHGADGTVKREGLLIGSRTTDLDPADFSPPRDYRRQNLMKKMGR